MVLDFRLENFMGVGLNYGEMTKRRLDLDAQPNDEYGEVNIGELD